MIQQIRVRTLEGDPTGQGILHEAQRTVGAVGLEDVKTARTYYLEGVTEDQAWQLAAKLLSDPISEVCTVNEPSVFDTPHVVEVGYKPGVMDPAVSSITHAAAALGIDIMGAATAQEFAFYGDVNPNQVDAIVGGLLVNKTVQHVITKRPETLLYSGSVGPVETIPLRGASADELMELSTDKLFLNQKEMEVIQKHFRTLDRDPTDVELETIAARWSEHCGHKTFNAKVIVDGKEKEPFIDRIKTAAKRHFGELVISAFKDNSGVIRFYDGEAICGKVETHNSPSAIEPYGGAMTGSGGVFRDIMGTGLGALNIISTNMYCLAKPTLDKLRLPPGTLSPRHLLRRIVEGVRDYGNRMGIPTGNGSFHFHDDFRAKLSVIVGAYGRMPEKYAEKGKPKLGDLVVVIGGRTGRDGLHGATFSSGEMTDRTIDVNSSAVQIGNAIEEKRMADALIEARDAGLLQALTDCGAAGFASAIGEMGEDIGVTVDLSKAPLKYEGMAPWEIWLSESQERMAAAISPENIEKFMEICRKHNVEATVLGKFDGSDTLTLHYGNEKIAELDYEFLMNGLPQRIMHAHWEAEKVAEIVPEEPKLATEWVARLKAVLSHGNVCSKEPIVRQYDHGVQGGNIVPPFGGIKQNGPNDALVVRPMLDKPYGIVQSHGMNPILMRHDPYGGTVWTFAEAAANYVAAGGNLAEAAAVGNYIWPFPDEEAMGSLDLSVDAAVAMMDLLKLPVISGKDSLSSTYRGKNGEVIKIPPVYVLSIFGRIPDVEKTMTSDIKKPGSKLYLVGQPNRGMGGSTYYEITDGSSNTIPTVDTHVLPQTFKTIHQGINSGQILACHDVSEGGVLTTVAEMCFGGDCGARIAAPKYMPPFQTNRADIAFFNETAGCFVVEVDEDINPLTLFGETPYALLGNTQAEKELEAVGVYGESLFDVGTDELKAAWQAPMQEVFHS